MKFFYFISLFVFALYFGSCNRNADMSNRNAAMDSSQMDTIVCAGEDDTPLDSIIAKIEYVKLRSREDHPVGAIDNLMITPDHIIVADYNLSRTAGISFHIRCHFDAGSKTDRRFGQPWQEDTVLRFSR